MSFMNHIKAVFGAGRERRGLQQLGLDVDALTRAMGSWQGRLRPAINEYCRDVSTAEMALSLKAASLLVALCEQKRPARVLDTGSGFSSYLLRLYARQARHPVEVWSVDDAEPWLARTAEFLKSKGLAAEKLMTWHDFADGDLKDFDLVLHDLGNLATRAQSLPELLPRLADGGLLLLDDVHHRRRLWNPAMQTFADRGFEVVTLRRLTLDGFGRWSCLASRPPEGGSSRRVSESAGSPRRTL